MVDYKNLVQNGGEISCLECGYSIVPFVNQTEKFLP